MPATHGPNRATVVIADDNQMVRHGFRMVLDAQPDLRVVADASNGAVALDRVRRHRPDVLVADIRMPQINGLELTRRITADGELDTRVIVVTAFKDDDYVTEALRAGAHGFLLKRSATGLLPEAVRAALNGNALISPEVTVRLLERLRPRMAYAQPAAPLTDREQEIASLVARGLSNDEIAHLLVISVGTVKTHVAHVIAKLGVQSRVGVAAWAWETGLVGRL